MRDLPSTAGLVSKYSIEAKKSFGQNFLFDANLCSKIARVAGDLTNQHVVEIGPGPGGLTRAILSFNPQSFSVVEKDKHFTELLHEIKETHPELNVFIEDALSDNWKSGYLNRQEKITIISNLPYNIGTELLVSWIVEMPEMINQVIVMLQKEVVERILSNVGTKSYGRLSVICQVICDVKRAFDVSADAFYPKPKVQSSVVQLIPKQNIPPQPVLDVLQVITNSAFGNRRKMIKSSMKNWSAILEQLGIDLTMRAENLSPQQYLSIASLSASGLT
jgi:16S rRNA (adenine1518-N6/adenine1519-N6)-dimethyltransferase